MPAINMNITFSIFVHMFTHSVYWVGLGLGMLQLVQQVSLALHFRSMYITTCRYSSSEFYIFRIIFFHFRRDRKHYYSMVSTNRYDAFSGRSDKF